MKTALYALLIFLAGGVAGAFLAPMIGRTFMRPPDTKQMAHHMFGEMKTRLHLTDAQAARIQPLMKKNGERMEEIRRMTIERVRAQLDATDAQISAVLTPEQKTEFAKMVAENRERHRREHEMDPKHHLPPPPPPSPDR